MIIQVSPAGSMDLLSQLEVERPEKNGLQAICTSFTATAALQF